MSGHGGAPARMAILLAGIAVLVAGHGFILYRVVFHTALSTVAVLGIGALVVIKHVDSFGPLYAWLRRRFRRRQ